MNLKDMIELNNVTLVCVDCRYYRKALNAILVSKKKIKFKNIIFFNDTPLEMDFDFCKPIPSIKNKTEYSHFVINKLADYIKTSHVLIIQHDGYVINPELWDNDWLNYDYIGAPWWYNSYNVGNGGFSLRSKKLLKATQLENFDDYHNEDDCICRRNRDLLEQKYDIKFAPEEVAKKFSYEPNRKRETFNNHTFGFHGVKNLL